MRALRPVVVSAALVAFAIVAIAPALEATGRARTIDERRHEPSAAAIEAAIEFRESFGLRADPHYVARSLTDPLGFPDTDWSVPLSLEKSADLRARLEVQTTVTAKASVHAMVRRGYGGAYYDQRRGGIPVFLFTDRIEEHRRALASRLPGIDFEVREVDVTLAELTRLQDAISGARRVLAAEGIELTSVSVDVIGNRVEVDVVEPPPAATARLGGFGGPLVIVAAPSRSSDPAQALADETRRLLRRLSTEDVEPRVLRILHDGHRRLSGGDEVVAIASDGTIWRAATRRDFPPALRSFERGRWRIHQDHRATLGVDAAREGVVWAAWSKLRGSDPEARIPDVLGRWDGRRWRLVDLPRMRASYGDQFAVAGGDWLCCKERAWQPVQRLVRFDGRRFETIDDPAPQETRPAAPILIDGAPDGTLWGPSDA